MQKQHLNQAIAGITAASLLVAQVPTAALAEALDEQGQAPVEQTQATEAAESPAADGTQQESSGQGAATQKDAPAQKDTAKSDDGIPYTTWHGWEVLDAHERSLGEAVGRERIKVVAREEMTDISRSALV